MENAKRIGCISALAVALGIGIAVAHTPAVASATPGDSGKGSTSGGSSSHPPSAKKGAETAGLHRGQTSRLRSDSTPPKMSTKVNVPAPAAQVLSPPAHPAQTLVNAVVSPFASSAPTLASQTTTTAADPDFITSTHNLVLLSTTSAADPDDSNFVAFVLSTPFFTDVLTSGTDPEGSLGLGAASTGVAGQTVNTFMSPLLTFSVAIPVTDPFAPIFTQLVQMGF